ncbi:MAG: S8 family serine peptidase [Microbacterium sp.]
MGLRVMRAAASATLVALVSGSLSLAGGAAFGASPVEEAVAPAPIESPTGSYIVLLDEAPAATYEGGESRFAPTKPEDGEKLDPRSASVNKYTTFLQKRQQEVAADAGIEPSATYQIVLNGFSAKMTPDAAARVAAGDGVLAVYPDEIFRPDSAPTNDAIGVASAGRLIGARVEADASGVVIGVIDTGIAPDNPSFAGERLRSVKGADPYLVGDTIVFEKADGREFRSARMTGDDWAKSDYSTKLIGAQYFATGAADAGFSFDHDVLSPRDSDGHGSRVASIAAGDSGVDVSIGDVGFGDISGVAPSAKIASYKACFVGEDPLVATDDVCVGSDLLAALDHAVADGVDVVGYSIGGGAGASEWAADDIALYNAAVAGVFVAVSAGNAGPAASTVSGGAPWYMTVAASTARTFEGTVQLSTGFEAAGVSVSVPPGREVTAPVVYAGDAGLPGSADARLCYPGTLDPEAVDGRIVVCDRGTNPRDEKSQEVADAGGVGMILVNVTPDSLDGDLHAVPTVHIDSSYRDALLADLATSPAVTATLIGENLTGAGIPTPQIAGFSGRGPIAEGSDILAPDVAAPGVAILAATADTSAGDPAWGIASGTSMAAAHVAGLAALYLEAHPTATPDEIKSALMTTASNTLEADGSANVDPFAQGAGQVDAERFLDPGLIYRSGPSEWAGFAQAQGHGQSAGADVAGSELNLPSIAVGALTEEHLVTRTLTATRPGTYDVAADIPGVDVTVSPSTLEFAAPGDTQQFTLSFTNDSAPVEVWATGLLTWTGEDGTSVRSPLAVRPVTADAASLVVGDGIAGSTEVAIVSGVTGDIALEVAGLVPVELLVDPDDPAPGHSGDETSGDEDGDIAWAVEVPTGSPLAEFTLDASDDSDLDLAVYRVASATDQRYFERWVSATPAAHEQVTLVDPTPGSYLVVASVGQAAEGTTWDLTSAIVGGRATGTLTVAPTALITEAGEEVQYTVSWAGLRHDTRYLGVIAYGDSAVRTVVGIDSGAAPPVVEEAPTVTGEAAAGSMLTVDPGAWKPDDLSFEYQWLRDGEPIRGAVAEGYRIRAQDVGTTLSAQVSAIQPGNVNPGIAVSDGVVVNAGSSVDVTINRYVGTPTQQYTVTVEVVTSRGVPATGSVSVRVDATQYSGTLADGGVTFALPEQDPGIHVVVAEYAGTAGVDGSTAVSGFVVND